MRDLGYKISERTVGRMLQSMGLRSKISRKYRYSSDSTHGLPAARNLLNRQFTLLKPNTVLIYIRTQQGWLYLCVMLDLFSRRVVGWKASHVLIVN